MDSVTNTSSDQSGVPAPGQQEAFISNREEYRKLCATEASIPIFATDWWLDATAGVNNWDVALVRTNGRVIGAMPYTTVTRFGMRIIQQPALTPMLGPWLLPNGEKGVTRLSSEHKIMQSLIEQLPPFDHFVQTWNKDLSNWLPFYWNGFRQTTEYTYVLPSLRDLDAIWQGFDRARRKHCKQCEERYKLRVRDDLPLDALIALQKMSLERRGVTASYSDDCLRRIDAACQQHNCRKILIVVDEAGRHYAGTYTIWDNNCAYALIKGADPKMFHTSAPSLCQWESIKFSATVASQYDFLGNMNETIEPYVRSFGTVQAPISLIMKTPSRLLRLRQGWKSAIASAR